MDNGESLVKLDGKAPGSKFIQEIFEKVREDWSRR